MPAVTEIQTFDEVIRERPLMQTDPPWNVGKAEQSSIIIHPSISYTLSSVKLSIRHKLHPNLDTFHIFWGWFFGLVFISYTMI